MDKLLMMREAAEPITVPLSTYLALLFTFIFVIIILIATVMTTKVTYRKSKYIYCQQLLKQSNLITDMEDLEYLKKIEPKMNLYAQRWWYNNSFSFMSRVNKMKKIAKKYNIEVEIWNK